MRRPRPVLSAIASLAVILAACGSDPVTTEPPASAAPSSTPAPTPGTSEVPFEPAAWPETGSACDLEGYTGRLGRIEAPDARTVRFTLCQPDGAFLARVAHPALAVVDAGSIAALADGPAAGLALAGTGQYRIDRWEPGVEVVLVAADGEAADGATPTIVIRWSAEAAQRALELQSATVDGIDGPGPLDIERIETQPELALVPRPGLATAYLAFQGREFENPRVRRAIASGLDRAALVAGAFPAGSMVPERVAPCVIPGACGGEDWAAFGAPAAAAALAAAKFDLDQVYQLHVPSRPIAGLPDPSGVAEAVQAQLDALGVAVSIDVMANGDYTKALAAGDLEGMYLGGVASTLADPSAFLAPLVGRSAAGRLRRMVPDVPAILDEALATADTAVREARYARVNEDIRDQVPLVPLAHPGSVAAFRADVAGVQSSPLGLEALGAFSPGDRSQIVFMQASEPAGAYCGDQGSSDAYRVCALVTEPLYGFAPGTATPEPRLAEACTPGADATVWTCTLRAGVTFHDGAALDAGDVLASFVAQWDEAQPLRVARPDASFTGWRTAFGASLAAPDGEAAAGG